MTPALGWLVVPACLLAARAGVHSAVTVASTHHGRSVRALALPPGCLYEGRWYTEGEVVSSSRSACLLCACVRGALSCRRRACAPVPDPPPDRCHVVHRKDSCCPELHCPNGFVGIDSGAKISHIEDLSDIATPASIAHACVEGGSVFAAGSAMKASSACEACFCLQGGRRCVTPKCLPPPHGCTARAAPGACCPTRYYCRHDDEPLHDRRHNCEVNGKWITEGERVVTEETSANCTRCFCLRGSVRCQPLACAPPLLGCEPLVRPGECCPHQYNCRHEQGSNHYKRDHPFTFTKIEDRAFHSSKPTKQETTTTHILTAKNTPMTSISNNLVATTKVKRKTNDPPPSSSQNPVQNATTQTSITKIITTTQETTTEVETEQPDETVKVIINGTINCTAEISSTSLPRNMSFDDAIKAAMDVQPRIPIVNIENLDHTYSPNDIITDRNINVFDDNESFTINVTSSLMTNTSLSTKPPLVTVSKPGVVVDVPNTSKKTKGDYDYDYTEPTLPPSLPNLKIIPFVAADAVVDEEPPKETLSYPLLEREDKFPVYYPNINQKGGQYASRREGVYEPTQYPVFVNKEPQYPSLTHEISSGYANHNDLEYTVAASLGNHVPEVKEVTKPPTTSTTFSVETPAVNLFSPPVKTEGGFVPRDPGIIDDYYAVYPSTPPGPTVPHLTTSMQLDIVKGECVAADGERIGEGENAMVGCARCDCAWGHLRCVPIDCPTPFGCRRTLVSETHEVCCGELVCDEDIISSPLPITTTEKSKTNDTVVKIENISLIMKVDTPIENTSIKNFSLPKIRVEDNIKINFKNITTERVSTQKLPNVSKTTTTVKPVINLPLTTEASSENINQTYNSSQEYDDDEEDEGFSFGSVLKLLLSDNYETTTTATKQPTTSKPIPTKPITTTNRKPSKPTLVPFIPLPPSISIPPSKPAINRIDHLVLGETTAIKTTRLPITIKPISKTTQSPIKEVKEQADEIKEALRQPTLGIGAGLLKLAGCNIYGRIYRVGRIIAELSTPCQECWCTEFGVQCKPLKC